MKEWFTLFKSDSLQMHSFHQNKRANCSCLSFKKIDESKSVIRSFQNVNRSCRSFCKERQERIALVALFVTSNEANRSRRSFCKEQQSDLLWTLFAKIATWAICTLNRANHTFALSLSKKRAICMKNQRANSQPCVQVYLLWPWMQSWDLINLVRQSM